MNHSQRPDKSVLVCQSCKADNCNNCVDVPRSLYTDDMICQCGRINHSGEAVTNQIQDPENSSVYGPYVVIDIDGNVVSDEAFKAKWREQFGD